MTNIYVPSEGPQHWRWLLAKPGLHWKHGADAFLARAAGPMAHELRRTVDRSALWDR